MKMIMMCVMAVVLVNVIGCASVLPNKPHVPAGYQTCHSDGDCASGQYCGFVEVDSYAVCKGSVVASQEVQ